MERAMTVRARACALALLGSACLISGSPAHAASYSFQTFNNSGDPAFNQLLGINNSGTIVGYFGDGNVAPNKGYTFVPPSTYTPENFPASVQTQVVGINNPGPNAATVGFFVDGAGNNTGFVNRGGTFTPVTNPSTPSGTTTNQLLGVNDHGVAVGFYLDAGGNAHGYTYNIGSPLFTAINFPSAASTTATGINNAGNIAGFFTVGGVTHGFLDIGGMFSQLDDPSGTDTMLLGLNNNGQAVGSYVDGSGETEGFLYNSLLNSWLTISDPLASSTAAFGVTGTTVNGINDLGDLVGFYSDGTNVNGFLATPTPVPAALPLFATGLGAMGLFGWRRKRKNAIAA